MSPSTTAAGTAATYTVGFRTATAVGIGGHIVLSETAGPTNFSTVNGVEVQDTTQGWTLRGHPSVPFGRDGTIIVNDTINAGDLVTVTLANVTNPPTADHQRLQGVDHRATRCRREAAPYSIGTSTSTSTGRNRQRQPGHGRHRSQLQPSPTSSPARR